MASAQIAGGDVAGDGSGDGSKHNILNIPLEMFERIAYLAEPSTLLNIRLLNKESAEKVQRVFAEVHFTKLAILFSDEDSMRTLLEIAKHSVFSLFVREICLCTEEIPDFINPPNGQTPEDRYDRARKDPAVGLPLHAQRMREWKRLYKAYYKFKDGDGDSNMLIVSLLNFQRHGNTPSVRVTDQGTGGVVAKGTKTLQKLMGEKLTNGSDDGRQVQVTLDALDLANVPLTSLTICFGNSLWSIYEIGSCPVSFEKAKRVFRKLKHLHIRTEQPFPADFDEEDIVATGRVFEDCPKLETICLDNYSGYREHSEKLADDHFVPIFLDQTAPVLRCLEIRGYPLPFNQLVPYIKRHQQLEEATFEACRFHTLGDFDDRVNNEAGMHSSCVTQLLRDATGLAHIKASGGSVRDWEVRETAENAAQ